MGIPSVALSEHEFIGVTSRGDYLFWKADRSGARIASPEFCHQIKEKVNNDSKD